MCDAVTSLTLKSIHASLHILYIHTERKGEREIDRAREERREKERERKRGRERGSEGEGERERGSAAYHRLARARGSEESSMRAGRDSKRHFFFIIIRSPGASVLCLAC
jgi:hypothetical protein